MCAGPRVQACVRAREDRQIDIALGHGCLSGDATPLGVRWHGPVTAPFHFVATTIDCVLRVAGREGPGFSVAFESSPQHGGKKLGLGSSARAAVLAAEAARVGLGIQCDSLKIALLGHATAQDGKGSGGDVAAIGAGGLIRYRRYAVHELKVASDRGQLASALTQSSPVELSRLSSPHFPALYAFTGESAQTPVLMAQVEARLAPDTKKRFVEESELLGDMLEQALQGNGVSEVSRVCESLQQLLDSLHQQRHENLHRLLSLAKSYGCGGKQSGAGGGDGVIIFAPDPETRSSLCEGLNSRGFYALPLELETGLRTEWTPHAELRQWLDAL